MRQAAIRGLWVFVAGLVLAPQTVAQELGESYLELDSRITRIETTFVDARAVTNRLADGGSETFLLSPEGELLATMGVSAETAALEIRLASEAAGRVTAELPFDREPVAVWLNRQLYTFWTDLRTAAPGAGLRTDDARDAYAWFDGFLRGRDAIGSSKSLTKRQDELLDRVTRSVATEFGDLAAFSYRVIGVETGGFVTALEDRRTGESLGAMTWAPDTETLAWDVPGLTQGSVSPSTFRDGGWRFEPTLGWANLQVLGFYLYHRAVSFEKDTPGCTGLHWLDNTIFRPCCDRHDLCFERADPNCTAWSWINWIWGNGRWECIRCNMAVVVCFATGGGSGGVFDDDPDAGIPGPGGGCIRVERDWTLRATN